MPLQPRGLIVHESVSCMHHGQVVEEDHISGLQLDLDCMFRSESVQGVERETLSRGERREGRRSRSRRGSCDAGAGEVDQDAAGEMIGEGDRAGIEGLGGRRAWETDVSVRLAITAEWQRAAATSHRVDAGGDSVPNHGPIAAKSVRELWSERCELLVHSVRVR